MLRRANIGSLARKYPPYFYGTKHNMVANCCGWPPKRLH